jgi:hypothetical protein
VLGIVGFALLLFCGACAAMMGIAISMDAPHAWKGDIRYGLVCWLIALALIFPAILLLRGSIRRLRPLRQVRMAGATHSETRTP